jgi:biofilm PGA synthesis N-glycosyltransferase PgaC
MKLLFWSSLFFVFFTYAGYPIWLYFRARLWPRPILRAAIFPSVTIILAVHNEAKTLPAKLRNLAELDYPQDRCEIIIVSDGSTDETNALLAAWENPKQRVVILPTHSGKATALNHGVAEARGEIIVFTDARQIVASVGLKNLVADFADSSVGCVSGTLMIGEDSAATPVNGMGLYWTLERNIRKWETLAGSTVGATGAFYAVRKDLLVPLPQGLILDDLYIPIHVVRQGQRVILEPRVLVWDRLMPGLKQEYRRKVRTLAGNYQLLQLAPWVLMRSNRLRFQFICHKLLRLLVPFALVGIFVSSLWLGGGAYEGVLVLQLVFYALAGLGASRLQIGMVSRMSNLSLTFIVLNTAAAVALAYFILGRKIVWAR